MVREVGWTLIVGAGVQTSSCVVLVVPRYVAVILVVVRTATPAPVTVNVPLVWPALTVTLAGIVAAEALSIDSGTAVAEPGAVPRVSVPVEGLPPMTGEGLKVSETIAGGAMAALNVATAPTHCVLPPAVAL